ncbi:hypothetical protein ZIOFF_023675 [Zingiber officinale]|uniref:DUF7794 domain-containing protein n=1 Tax=Zingiber officinale TaxID=94328 RepID=A0A8J5GZF9_ZINOF|nr:hypothetical protein ZIOFF_023675 [Zingiber officinale]
MVKFLVEPLKSAGYMNNQNGNVFTSRISGSSKVTLEISGEDEVSVVPLNDPLDPECDAACLDKELTKLATWMGGSYVGTILSLDGKLLKADFQFAVNLVSLIRNVKKAMEIHEDLSRSTVKLSEIMMGHFTGIEYCDMVLKLVDFSSSFGVLAHLTRYNTLVSNVLYIGNENIFIKS